MKTTISSIACAPVLLIAIVLGPGCGPTPPGNGDSCASTGTTGGVTTVSYADDIVPLFMTTGCLNSTCHGGTFPASQYDMRTYAALFVAGDDADRIGACEIVPGDAASSFLIEKLRSSNPRVGLQMPLEREPLTEEEIVLIETWIDEGAQDN